eukprot:8356120-Pyramimonas_sp.AAC.1
MPVRAGQQKTDSCLPPPRHTSTTAITTPSCTLQRGSWILLLLGSTPDHPAISPPTAATFACPASR